MKLIFNESKKGYIVLYIVKIPVVMVGDTHILLTHLELAY